MPSDHDSLSTPATSHSTGELDLDRPNAARMYDYYLGGNAHFAVDRQAAERVLAVMPDLAETMRANRAFLGRVVRYCLAHGVRQFLDLGSGIPTVGNVHEIAHGLDPHARVAYVDNEPVAVAHSQRMLAETSGTTITHADLRDPETVLTAPTVTGLLDFAEPVGILAVSVLNFVPSGTEIRNLLARYTSAVPAGSYLAISHVTLDHHADGGRAAQEQYYRTNPPSFARSYTEVAGLTAPFELVEPGLVAPNQWHPDTLGDTGSAPVACWAGMARL